MSIQETTSLRVMLIQTEIVGRGVQVVGDRQDKKVEGPPQGVRDARGASSW